MNISATARFLGFSCLLACSAPAPPDADVATPGDTADAATAADGSTDTVRDVRRLGDAPPGFTPVGFSSEDLLWGVARGRLTRIDVRDGSVTTHTADVWSAEAAADVVSWRGGDGTWYRRGDGRPIRVVPAGEGAPDGFDGPPALLWAPDGSRAILSWWGEWDGHHELFLSAEAERTPLATRIAGYYLNAPLLWLDANRVLFTTVAMGPVGGAPEYREAGWRGDLAVLDVETGRYERVTTVADGAFLRAAGHFHGGVLVTEWGDEGIRGHWLYDPKTWQRAPADLPPGRILTSLAGAAVMLLDPGAETTPAVLVAGSASTPLGTVTRDAAAVFSPSGRWGALRTGDGLLLIERVF
jgi:hypothetical protein